MAAAVKSLQRLPDMIAAVGIAGGAETVTLQRVERNLDTIMEKLAALQRKVDRLGGHNDE